MLEGQSRPDRKEKRPKWIFLSAAALPLMMAALLFTVFTVTVQADAPLARPSSLLPPPVPLGAFAPSKIPPDKANLAKRHRIGTASWYGARFDGRVTASGERYDMYAMTACDNTLPFGSLVRVVNLKNHRSAVVRINDHGSLLPGRVIDVSYAAAKKLRILHDGLANVSLEVISRGSRNRK